MRALSVKQPNAEKILRGTKIVEYRDRPTKIRERVCLYASKTPGARADFEEMGAERLAVPLKPLNRPLPIWFYPFDA